MNLFDDIEAIEDEEMEKREAKADAFLELLISAPIPELQMDGLIMKQHQELAEKLRDVISYGTCEVNDVEKKKEILEYLSMVTAGIDTFIELHNVSV